MNSFCRIIISDVYFKNLKYSEFQCLKMIMGYSLVSGHISGLARSGRDNQRFRLSIQYNSFVWMVIITFGL